MIADSIADIAKSVGTAIDEVHTSDEELARQNVKAISKLSEVDVKQIGVGKLHAVNPSFFISGVRPSIMWICAITIALHFLVFPIVELFLSLLGIPVIMPVLPFEPLFTLITGMLGLGAYRSYDKAKGTDTKYIGKLTKQVDSYTDEQLNKEMEKWVR